jgi:parallel beta-helix repeat protein
VYINYTTADITEPDLNLVSPSDMDTTTTNNYTYVNLSASETISFCWLSWNGTNESMTVSTDIAYVNKTTLNNGNYTYSAYCNDTSDNWNQTTSYWVYINYTPPAANAVTSCQFLDLANTLYTMTANILNNSLTEACLNITAENVTLDCNNKFIKSDDNVDGIFSNQINTTIRNCNVSMNETKGSTNNDVGTGIRLIGANNSYVHDNILNRNRFGIFLVNSNNTRIENTETNNNLWNGIFLWNNSNILIKNVTANSNSGGIYIEWDYNDTLIDITINGNTNIGIDLWESSDLTLKDISGTGNGGYGIYQWNSSRNNLIDIFINDTHVIYSYGSGIGVDWGSDNNLINITSNYAEFYGFLITNEFGSISSNRLVNTTANYNEKSGLIIWYSPNNTLTNVVANNNSEDGVYLYMSPTNTFLENSYYNNSKRGIRAEKSSNNMIIDSVFSGNIVADVMLITNSTNNTFLNASYNPSDERVSSDSELIRKWYVVVNVTNSSGDPVDNVNVSFFNSTSSLADYNQTQSNGLTRTFDLVEYVNTSTASYWTNYTLYANDSTGTYDNHTNTSVDFSMNIQIDVVMQPETVPPSITINSPTNDTIKEDSFNFTYSENVSCSLYSVDGGSNVTNCTISGKMWTGNLIGLLDGYHNVTVYANDTAGNPGSATRYWTRDTDSPDLINLTNGTVYGSRAYIEWITDEGANSTIFFGTNDTNLTENTTNTSFITSHVMSLYYLTKNTTHYYNVTSCDNVGNCNTTNNLNLTTPYCTASWSCGSWSSCSGGQQSRSCTQTNYCEYPWSKIENQNCDTPSGPSDGWSPTPPANVSTTPDLEPGDDIMNNTKLQTTIENVLGKADISGSEIEEMMTLSSSVTADISANRMFNVSGGKTTITTNMKYGGERRAKNFMVFESLPKTFANNAALVTVSAPGARVEVVEEDPSWLFLFSLVNTNQEITITYEVSGIKSSNALSDMSSEVYVESFAGAPPPSPPTPICAGGSKRCYEDQLQQCSSDGLEWGMVESCGLGCNISTLECNTAPSGTPSPEPLFDEILYLLSGILIVVAALIVAGTYYLLSLNKTLKRYEKPGKPSEAGEIMEMGDSMDDIRQAVEKSAAEFKETLSRREGSKKAEDEKT